MDSPKPRPAHKPRRKKLIRRLVTAVLIVAVLGAGAWFGYRMMSGPAQGSIATVMPDSESSQAPPVELEQFDGKFITFAHPSTYIQRTVKDPPASSLESDQFVVSGMINKLLTVSVTSLPSGKLADDASYYMRSIHPETYKITKVMVQGEPVMVALNSQDYQQAAFWAHGGKLLTFALSSVSMDSNDTNNEYQQMLQSVKWR
jgi:hypothetical protein